MPKNITVKLPGINFLTITGLVFVTLKLTGHIGWSWWWVLAPFWVPFVPFIAVCLLFLGLGILLFGILALEAVIEAFKKEFSKKKRF